MQKNPVAEISFERHLFTLIQEQHKSLRSYQLLEKMGQIPYEDELKYKLAAIRDFWSTNRLPHPPNAVIPSPRPRNYRTTTKRKVLNVGGVFKLHFSEDGKASPYGNIDPSCLEPWEHTELYRNLSDELNHPRCKGLANALNFIIIRGDYEKRVLIFNVFEMNGSIVKQLKNLAEKVSSQIDKGVVSSHSFHDPDRSRFYFDTSNPDVKLRFKTLFGPGKMEVSFGDNKFRFVPTIFSQINGSMVPTMISRVRYLLSPFSSSHLVDLFCGYGLFSHALAGSFAHVIGIESNDESARAAIENGKLNRTSDKIRIYVARISRGTITNCLSKVNCHPEFFFCDPPRQGMDQNAIAEVCLRRPENVVLACCGTDAIPGQVSAFKRGGYSLKNVETLDMFPGTPHLETLLVFKQ
jgi:tRNA/tmRNA/rRNA uracil-C5-methylase (TrmA/RlmC/RlmD family)